MGLRERMVKSGQPASAMRVLARYVQAAGNINGMRGTYFNLGWNKTRWQIEESDEPIVSGDLFGTARLPTYEMPTQFKPCLSG